MKLRKLIAAILAIALLVQILPTTIFAAEGDAGESELPEELLVQDAAESLEEAEILYEVTELREANVKHFRLESGAFLAVAYDSPVHYQDSLGQWQEFDNTLLPVNSNGEITAYRIRNGTHYRVFAADANADQLLYVSRGQYSIALTPQREETLSTGMIDLESSESAAPVTILTAAAPAAEEDTFTAQMQPQKFYSALEYTEAFEGADLRYENYGTAVKESIIIDAPQESYSYTFEMTLNNLTPTLEEDGGIVLRSAEGEGIYTIPAPYMIDANDACSTEAYYELEETSAGWLLTVTADTAWMNSAERVFPVLLDPTIEEDTGDELDVSAAYTSESYKTSVMSDGSGGLYLGYNGSTRSTSAGNGAMRCYFHINTLPEIPEGCEITNGTFSLYHVYQYTGPGTNVSTAHWRWASTA